MENDRYYIAAGVKCKVVRHGETPRDHETQTEQYFGEVDLVAGGEKVPDDNPAAAQWARRGFYVFRRGDWYLIVVSYEVQIAF